MSAWSGWVSMLWQWCLMLASSAAVLANSGLSMALSCAVTSRSRYAACLCAGESGPPVFGGRPRRFGAPSMPVFYSVTVAINRLCHCYKNTAGENPGMVCTSALERILDPLCSVNGHTEIRIDRPIADIAISFATVSFIATISTNEEPGVDQMRVFFSGCFWESRNCPALLNVLFNQAAQWVRVRKLVKQFLCIEMSRCSTASPSLGKRPTDSCWLGWWAIATTAGGEKTQLNFAINDCLSTLLLSDCTIGRDFMKMIRLGSM